jgi:glycosyltransferase involved in cell wall biosynthesis
MYVITRYLKADLYGGVEQKISLIAEALSKRSIDVLIITGLSAGRFQDKLKDLDIKFVVVESRLEMMLVLLRLVRKIRVLQSHEAVDSILVRFIKLIRPSIIHLYRVHTYMDGYFTGFRKLVVSYFDMISSFLVDRYVILSKALENEILCNDRKKYLLRNGIDIPRSRPCHVAKTQLKTIAIIGDIQERKQIVMTVQALLNCSNFEKIYIAGNPKENSEFERLNRLISSNSDIIEYLGFLDRVGVELLLKRVDCVCLLSKAEGLPTVLLESFYYGAIPVFNNVGGVGEVLFDKVNGFVMSFDNLDELVRISRDEELIKRISRNSYDSFTKEYTKEFMANYFIRIYELF